MTGDLIPLFEGKEVRVLINTVTGTGEPWFPLTDLAAAWGTDPAAPYHIVGRNPEVFHGFSLMSCDIDVTATSGKCVNEQGLYLLMGKISAGRLKNPEAKAAIIRFQRWVPELIQRYRKKEIAQIVPAVQTLEAEIQRARTLAKESGRDDRAYLAIAYRKCGMPEYVEALNLAPGEYIYGEPGWYNPTELVKMLNDPQLTAERLNWYLHNNPKNPGQGPYQYRDENHLWRLTDLGREHGREYPFYGRGGHQEPRIEWRESILYASGLKRQEHETTALVPVGA